MSRFIIAFAFVLVFIIGLNGGVTLMGMVLVPINRRSIWQIGGTANYDNDGTFNFKGTNFPANYSYTQNFPVTIPSSSFSIDIEPTTPDSASSGVYTAEVSYLNSSNVKEDSLTSLYLLV
eukprot:TRINITY_DN4263_c0_g2_i1.p1 TRINITY_DN4263_c0_g2~~TRINITY_DN4263_c0_g2_i1.p1  ORF type:complete len:120 (+),score=16.35 TRINITY_DN4263_c0_g2_i1:95-454(+)